MNYPKVWEFYTCVSKGTEIHISKRYLYLHTPMFIAALFTIVKILKQPECPSNGWMSKGDTLYVYNGIVFSHERDGNPDIRDTMNGTWGHWDKSDSERQILYGIT